MFQGRVSEGLFAWCRLAKSGLRRGDESTQPHLEKYCGVVQTTFFDGITVSEHGAELRNRCKKLNEMIEIVVRDQKFS